MSDQDAIRDVKGFWNTEACGTNLVSNYEDDRDFFEQYRKLRYQTEWHIPALVASSGAGNKTVLEIGCGNGADGVLFAKSGAIYTGVDLTEAAVEATRRHFAILGLNGIFQIENAESLSFDDESFDTVYSYGVLHHTPNPAAALSEVHRVLKPGGRAIIMLYHKRSFNYYARILCYMRLRVLARIVRRIGRWRSDRLSAGKTELKGVRGNSNANIWSIHYESFLRQGWSYLRAANFVHHCTDGPECPFAFCYTKSDARRLFARFGEVHTTVAHFPLRRYSFGKLVPFNLEKLLAARIGWYLIVTATKQPASKRYPL